MELSVEEFIEGLLTKEASELPSDTVKLEKLTLTLPSWFNREQYNKGRRFFWDFCYAFFLSMVLGFLPIFSIQSILRVLIGTNRSNTKYTAYKRYNATFSHVISWFEHELTPGSVSWKSLHAARSRHLRAVLDGKLKNFGTVSQRDLALTQFGFVGYTVLKPEKFGIRQLREGDWEAYNHFWGVIGHMIGIEDRFNVCRKNIDETRQVCQILLERVFAPNVENVPEYFEHMIRVAIEGMKTVIPGVDFYSTAYVSKYMTGLPGYIYSEADRIALQKRLQLNLNGKPLDTGVLSSSLILKPLDDRPTSSRLLYFHDYESFETAPAYRQLPLLSKIKLHTTMLLLTLNSIYVFRILLNGFFKLIIFTMRYFPYGAFSSFGFKGSFVDPFKDTPVVYSEVKPNAKYYEEDKIFFSKSWYDVDWFWRK